MIQSYKDPRVQKLYNGEDIRVWSPIRRQAEKRLRIPDAADRIETLMLLPSNHFEALHGDRQGQYSIRIMTSGEFVLHGLSEPQAPRT
ncbi:hypothetical protein FACS1894206_05120 [Deltaproteobacteria bacterium]|nr:hypothetical protein FACS1894206_05120 [Deltaproteobacteria bacterium]